MWFEAFDSIVEIALFCNTCTKSIPAAQVNHTIATPRARLQPHSFAPLTYIPWSTVRKKLWSTDAKHVGELHQTFFLWHKKIVGQLTQQTLVNRHKKLWHSLLWSNSLLIHVLFKTIHERILLHPSLHNTTSHAFEPNANSLCIQALLKAPHDRCLLLDTPFQTPCVIHLIQTQTLFSFKHSSSIPSKRSCMATHQTGLGIHTKTTLQFEQISMDMKTPPTLHSHFG